MRDRYILSIHSQSNNPGRPATLAAEGVSQLRLMLIIHNPLPISSLVVCSVPISSDGGQTPGAAPIQNVDLSITMQSLLAGSRVDVEGLVSRKIRGMPSKIEQTRLVNAHSSDEDHRNSRHR